MGESRARGVPEELRKDDLSVTVRPSRGVQGTESIGVVLDSVKLLDQYVGRMRPNIDGTAAVAQ
jgi:hypothetical protein